MAPRWNRTRGALRTAIRRAMRTLGGSRHGIAWMLRVVREARFAALVAGAVVVGFGVGSANASPTIQLSDITAGIGGFAIDGEAAGDRSGRSVSVAGDVNGDGLADLIVGAFWADPNGSNSGRSYVVFGKASGTGVELSDITMETGGFAMDGEGLGDEAGVSVSNAGDVNGDGLADLIVGAHRADPNGFESGRIYVIFGRASENLVQLSDVANGIGGFAIDGTESDNFSGSQLSDAGDVNGDGLADLIVGGASALTNEGNSDRVYVIFGKATGTRVQLSDIPEGAGGFSIDGEADGDRAGNSVSGGGDVNGDGLADLIVGAPRADSNAEWSGRTYVVFGKATGTRVQLSDVTDGSGGFAIDGEAAWDESGWSLSTVGDVNGDGLADLIVMAPRIDTMFFTSRSNRFYLVFGKRDGTRVQLSNIAAGTGGFAIEDATFLSYGAKPAVSAAGDVNGDGLADMIIAHILDSPRSSKEGRSYVIFGKTTGTLVELSAVAAGAGGFAIEGEAAEDRSGKSVSGGGDINGDGLDDLIVSAVRVAPYGDGSGRSYVIFSPETPPLVAPADVPRSAIYNAFSRAGDGPGGNPVVPTVVGDSRLTIDWPDDDFGSGMFNFQTSKERVVLNRNNFPIQNLEPITNVARVCWGVLTNRPGAGPAELTFKYVDHEIAGITLGTEADLAIFAAEEFEGPWIKLPTTIDAARNTARVTSDLSVFKHFALAESATASVAPVNAARAWDDYR